MVSPWLSQTAAPWIEPEESTMLVDIRAGSDVHATRPSACGSALAALGPAAPSAPSARVVPQARWHPSPLADQPGLGRRPALVAPAGSRSPGPSASTLGQSD